MFSLPQLSTQDEQDGCPVVDMPDSAEDFACLLRAFYEPFMFSHGVASQNRSDFDAACGILRLSTKYIMPAIRKRSIEHLECYFPTNWIEFRECASTFTLQLPATNVKRAIGVAREAGVQWILPAAFYWLSQSEIEVIFADNLAQLSIEDLKACMQGREALNDAVASRGVIVKLAVLSRKNHKRAALLSFKIISDVLCHACSEYLTLNTDAWHKEVWEKLPEWFGLPLWPELLAARAAQ
ncbi:hypothetical protein FIBSPDRAFT_848812 [Athelia psychrophila]|uniref:BTB domain-containing protein n=1 Tax=Athelia psychrophila TaxID=1759441 RepID=A0A166V6U9_9AGAM|nr:hypothetical protein FIBSPDRAFT_848812 [Fibularhizoctonia sp. CBS 109695]